MSVHEVDESFVNVRVTPLCPPAPGISVALTFTCASEQGEEPPLPAEAGAELALPVTGPDDATFVVAELTDEVADCDREMAELFVDFPFCDNGEEFVVADWPDPPPQALIPRVSAPAMVAAASFD